MENEIQFGDSFLRDARKIPKATERKLARMIFLLRQNAFDPRLHTEPLGIPLSEVYAFRITRGWRVGFYFIASHTIKLLAVDDRGQIYQRLRRLLGR